METAIHSEHYNGLSLNLHNGVFSDYSLGGHSIPTRDLDDRSNDQQQQQQQQQQSSSQSQQQRQQQQQQQQQQDRHQENGTPQRVQKRNSSDSAGNGNGGSGTSGGGGGSGGGSGSGGQAKRPGRKCGTHLRFADIDARMLQWMLEMNAYKVPLSDSTIQAKAKQLAQVLGTNDFKASSGWLYKFKERHGFVMSSKAAQSSMGVGAPAPTHPLSTHSHSAPPSMTASQHSPPGPPMVPPNACLPSEYPPPVSIAAVVPHPGMQQRGGTGLASAMPSHQQLSSLGPSPVHLSGHMAPPPPPPHTPRDLVTPPPLGQSQQIPSLGPSPFLPPPPQHISPPPAVQTPGKPSPDYELARYHQTLNDYDPSRIYTVSETCLLYNKLPRDTLTDTLNPESRMTILLCANADGTHKLRPLVINSRRDGEDFNEDRAKLPVSYETQRSSYMTGKIFQQWIWELERRVEYPCVLLLDASPAHVSVQSDKITLLKLHNSLRQLQPLNQGAMTEFKARYKAEMISRIEQRYKQIGQGSNCSGGNSNGAWILTPPEAMLSFVDALNILSQAWKSLSRESLLESWTRSQLLPFRMYNGRKDIEEEAIQELSQVIKSSKICCGEFISNAQGAGSLVGTPELGLKEIAEYLHLDDTIETSYSFSEEAFESSRAPQGYTSEAMDTALMQYYHLQRSRQQTPEEILAMLDTMERFFTHQALISSTDILAIHSLRTKTYQIASNYFPPTSSMLSSASSLGAPPPVVSPPMSSATPHSHLSPHSQYTPPLLAGPSLVPTVHQQPPYPVSY